jgi:hypothetical protein
MQLFLINNKVIFDIVENLTLEDKSKEILKNVILRFDYNYINFIYTMFNVYTTYYFSIMDENSNLSHKEVIEILNKFSNYNIKPDLRHVFIADVYDILYSVSSLEKSKFNSYFYGDMFNRIENLYGPKIANSHMEVIFDSLETIFKSVEETIIYDLDRFDKIMNLAIIYIEMENSLLKIYIL